MSNHTEEELSRFLGFNLNGYNETTPCEHQVHAIEDIFYFFFDFKFQQLSPIL